jgi:NADPH:quinone reductase-like Zn-dependent oxidoreductase
MKAVIVTGYGPPEDYTVADVPAPRPGPGQIQVRVAAASINPADVRLPSGEFRDVVSMEFPHVPGNDFAGTVSEVGAGVTAYWIGRDDVGLHFVLDMDGTYGGMREVSELAVAGELPTTIGRRYTLDQGAQACVEFLRLHTTGKLVVTM